jgi:hypothetical protein
VIAVTRRIAASVIVLALTACGAESKPDAPVQSGAAEARMTTPLSEALEGIKSEVDDLVAQLFPDAGKRPRFDNGKHHSCNDAEGAPTGLFRSQFGYVVDASTENGAALLAAAERFFAAKGMSVNTDHARAVFAEGNGYSYSAVVNSVGELVVGGTTPCFPA